MVDRKSTKDDSEGTTLPLPTKDPSPIYTTWPQMIKNWPLTTLCIVSNEFCERFSFYGMRTVLAFYILNVLKFSKNASSIFFNLFGIMCFVTPIGGSIIADGFIGKFWTIFSVSILYAAGQVVLAIASVQNYQSSLHPTLDIIGLVVIAFGTGGIKPCVSAFGGDQFDKKQQRMISVYFSMFYFSINAGSMISSFITPIFRARPCLGQDTCFPLAFGIPAVLMLCATGVFMLGSFWYKKAPPTENAFLEVGKIVGGAIGNKVRGRGMKREHWLLYYLNTHTCEADPKCMELKQKTGKNKCFKKKYVEDARAVFRLLIMFLPVPFFWCLYDQQSTFWVFQAVDMNCEVFNGYLLLPDQIQTLNAVLILVFIPLFQVVVYPTAARFFEVTPLRKMVAGGVLAALAFVATGIVQLKVNMTLPVLPADGQSFVGVMNLFDDGCNITVTPLTDTNIAPAFLLGNTSMIEKKGTNDQLFHIKSGQFDFNIAYAGNCLGNEGKNESVSYDFASATMFYLAVGPRGIMKVAAATEKPTLGTGEFSLGITLATDKSYAGNLALCRTDADGYDENHPCDPTATLDFYYWETDYNDHTNDVDSTVPVTGLANGGLNYTATVYAYKPVRPGSWELFYMYNRPKDVDHETMSKTDVLVNSTGVIVQLSGQGGVHTMVVTGPGEGFTSNKKHLFQSVPNNEVSILWQVIQVTIITAAEILFSVTGYEFVYSQSPPSMKALVQGFWLLTNAIGDSITNIITALNIFTDMATEFFAYAGIMMVVMTVFALMSIFYYEYNYYTKEDVDDDSEDIEPFEEKERRDTGDSIVPSSLDEKM